MVYVRCAHGEKHNLTHFDKLIPKNLLSRVIHEGRPWLKAPNPRHFGKHPLQAYIPDVYIFLLHLSDARYKIGCVYCNIFEFINAKEFTSGRRVMADGRSYWFIGRRYRCTRCQKSVQDGEFNGLGDNHVHEADDDDDDHYYEEGDDFESSGTNTAAPTRHLNKRYSFTNYHPRILQLMGYQVERTIPCIFTRKMGLDKKLVHRLSDPESNPVETLEREFNER